MGAWAWNLLSSLYIEGECFMPSGEENPLMGARAQNRLSSLYTEGEQFLHSGAENSLMHLPRAEPTARFEVTPISEDLRCPQSLKNRRFCVIKKKKKKKIMMIFNSRKSDLLRNICKNSKITGFASTAKTLKSEVLRSFKYNLLPGFAVFIIRHVHLAHSSWVPGL